MKGSRIALFLAAGLILALAIGLTAFDDFRLEPGIDGKPAGGPNAHFRVDLLYYDDTGYLEVKGMIREAVREIGCDERSMSESRVFITECTAEDAEAGCDEEFTLEREPTRPGEIYQELGFACPGLKHDQRMFSLADSLDGVSYRPAPGPD